MSHPSQLPTAIARFRDALKRVEFSPGPIGYSMDRLIGTIPASSPILSGDRFTDLVTLDRMGNWIQEARQFACEARNSATALVTRLECLEETLDRLDDLRQTLMRDL